MSNVINSLIFVFSQVLERFNSEINDLTQILLMQSGQISKSQLVLSPGSDSRVTLVLPNFLEEPLTLLRLEQVLVQLGLFTKIRALSNIMQKGILDFVAHNQHVERENANKPVMLFDLAGDQENQDYEKESFLLLADSGEQQDQQPIDDNL